MFEVYITSMSAPYPSAVIAAADVDARHQHLWRGVGARSERDQMCIASPICRSRLAVA